MFRVEWITHGAGDRATDRALLVLQTEAPDLIRTAGRTAPYGEGGFMAQKLPLELAG